MSRKKIDRILEESLEQRELGLKEYQSFGQDNERIAAKIALLDEQIEHLLDKREQIKDQWGEAHQQYERDLREINSLVEINKWLLQNEEVEFDRSGINSDEALLLVNLLSSSAEDTLRLAEDDRNQISSIMERLDEQLQEKRGGIQSYVIGDVLSDLIGGGDCSGCKGSCKDSCKLGCEGTCFNSCGGGCMATCEGGCFGGCKESCMAGCYQGCMGCTGNCMGGCGGGCLGPIKAGK